LIWLRIPLPKIQQRDWKIQNFKELEEWQRVNRFPAIATQLNQKDNFARNYKRTQSQFGEEVRLSALPLSYITIYQEFSFHPYTYVLPEDLEVVKADITQSKLSAGPNPPSKFIMKPCFGGQGAGIRLIHDESDLPSENLGDWLIQRYEGGQPSN